MSPFIDACLLAGTARVALFMAGDHALSARYVPDYQRLLPQLWDQVEVVPLDEGLGDLDRFGAFIVAGGPVQEYHRHLHPLAATVRGKVESGAPYLGFSAGAMLASSRALLGGFQWNGVDVSSANWSEDVDEVTVQEGLGLVPWTVEVHAAQAGTLGRAMAAAATHPQVDVVALDEDTALHVTADAHPSIRGAGHTWWIRSRNTRLEVHVHRADH